MWKSINKYFLAAALLVSITPATPASALDWHDPEWAGLGCPSELSGNWVPLTHSSYTGLKIEFKSKGLTLSPKENSTLFFAFSPNAKDESYMSLKRVSDYPSFPKYLKIRPHLAVQSISEGRKYTLCKIKVFLFDSEQKANQMSYVSWDIYSTIDSIEVPHDH